MVGSTSLIEKWSKVQLGCRVHENVTRGRGDKGLKKSREVTNLPVDNLTA